MDSLDFEMEGILGFDHLVQLDPPMHGSVLFTGHMHHPHGQSLRVSNYCPPVEPRLTALQLPPTLHAPRASSLGVPSLSGASTASSSAFDSRPPTPLNTVRLMDNRPYDVSSEYQLPPTPRPRCIPLPDVGPVEAFEVVDDFGNMGDIDMEGARDDYSESGFDDPDNFHGKLEALELRMDLVRIWRGGEEHADNTYGVAVPESLDEAWNGTLDAKTPRAPVSALPAPPLIRVSRP
ncbi:hypothetical protein PENSPDRAFT_734237 [Peniophora sp. CONT]|nr:hypothetical protein PENSPDRAFT_734237 [Peniophora sp. CONT]